MKIKKKYVLKDWVIELLIIILFTLFMTACVCLYFERIETINNWDRVVELK